MARPRKVGFWIRLAAVILKPLLRVFTRRTWRGAENIPATGGCLVVANHVSMTDPPMVAHYLYDAGRVPHFLAKASLFSIPVVGRFLHGSKQIPVYRNSREAAQAFSAAVAAVNRGECVVVYPEGTVTADPDLWPMVGKTGAARIALATGAPVIPLAHWGSHRMLPPDGKVPRLFRRTSISIVAGPAIDLGMFADAERTPEVLRAVTARFLTCVTDLLAELRDEPPPATSYDPRAEDSRGTAAESR